MNVNFKPLGLAAAVAAVTQPATRVFQARKYYRSHWPR